ncbi:MAG: ABC transporter permease [Victivallales bacterium]|nr:ABC transporter permease [Victivallales bacterium]
MIFSPSRFIQDVELGIKNLLLHKLRSLLTMLGLVFGVGSVIAMLAVQEGASEEALRQIRLLGSKNIIISAQKPAEEAGGTAMRSWMSVYGLNYTEEDLIRKTMAQVKTIVPVKQIQKQGRYGQRSLDMRVVGTNEKWLELVQRPMIAGRFLNEHDVYQTSAVVVLTEHGARRLLATEGSVGEVLRLGSDNYLVIGIVKSEEASEGSMQTPDKQTDAYIPISTAKEHYGDHFSQRLSGTNIREMVQLHHLLVEVDDESNVEAVAKNLERMYQMTHKKKDYVINVPLALIRQKESQQRLSNIVFGAIAGISLLVGGIGIMNIMLASVTERTREIGIRRAIGAKQRQIVSQFLIETIVLSVTGGIIGIGVGKLIPWIISQAVGMPTHVTTGSMLLSLGISVSVGLIFGIYPALRAAKLDPIVALRHE